MPAQQRGHDPALQHQRIDPDEVPSRGDSRGSSAGSASRIPARSAVDAAHAHFRLLSPSGTSWFRLSDPARTPWHSQACSRAGLQHALQHEHHGRRGHVAVVPEHLARRVERCRDRVRATVRPHRGPIDHQGEQPRSRCRTLLLPRISPMPVWSASWMAPGTCPDSTISKPSSFTIHDIRSRPSDRDNGMGAVEAKAERVGRNEAAAQPSPHRQNESSFSRSLVCRRCNVQSSIFTTSTRASRLGSHDMAGQFERVDCGVTPHEPDNGAFDSRRQSAASHEFQVQTRSRKSGACRQNQMRDPGRSSSGKTLSTAVAARIGAPALNISIRLAVPGKAPLKKDAIAIDALSLRILRGSKT